MLGLINAQNGTWQESSCSWYSFISENRLDLKDKNNWWTKAIKHQTKHPRPLLWTRISGLLKNPNNSPMTPRLVSRRYSKGRVLLTVCKKGYRKSGMCAARNADLEENNNQIQSPELSSKNSKHSNFQVVNS